MNIHTHPELRSARVREPVDDELAPSTLRVQQLSGAARKAPRLAGACATVLAHGAVAAAFLFVAPQVHLVELEPFEVSILPDAPERQLEPERKVEIKPPEMTEVLPPIPEFETPITAITMAAPPPPPPASPKVQNSYYARLLAHLNRFKRYPDAARLKREHGVVQIRFSIDRTGHVLSFAQVKSSGSSALDDEARQMVARAEPFPPIPDDLARTTLDLVVPVEFEMH